MRRFSLWGTLALAAVAVGCTTAATTNTARSSTEQLLIANAVDQSLDKVNFSDFAGYNVYLQEKYVDCTDKNYVIASIRHRMLTAGARLVDAPDKADIVVEPRAGAVGTSSAVSFLGVPEITLPGMLTLPEVRLVERKKQEGTAKIGIVAFDPRTNAILGNGGISLARADDSNFYVFGVGPYQDGSILREVRRATSGQAAVKRSELSNVVAFDAPPSTKEVPTQLASEPDQSLPTPPNPQKVTPAKAESVEPDWAKSRR